MSVVSEDEKNRKKKSLETFKRSNPEEGDIRAGRKLVNSQFISDFLPSSFFYNFIFTRSSSNNFCHQHRPDSTQYVAGQERASLKSDHSKRV